MKEDLTKHTLHLFTGDFDQIAAAYPDLSAAKVIRTLVRAHLTKLNPPVDIKPLKHLIGDY